jgi:hypothetical protein
MRETKAERKWRQRQSAREREAEQRAANESDFARYDWTGQKAGDEFFKLHDQPQFGGTGSSGVVLPPHSLSVSRHPTVGAAVINAYAHGLEYAEQVFGAGGLGLFSVIVWGIPFGYMTASMWADIGGFLFPLLTAFSVAGFLFMYRFDTVGYRYTPVMFNRALGKVHVFRDQTKLFSLWPLWGGGKCRIDTYDWSCVRAQVSRFRTFSGTVAQDNAKLGCIVLKAPDRAELAAEFPLGITSSALAVQNLLDYWEHIRRYMEHESPMFPEGEGPYEQPTTQSLLGAIFFGQPFIGPGWRENYETADVPMMLWQILALFLFPVTMTFGLLRWVSLHIRTKPKWPAEILASVGGAALHGDNLDAWRKVIPERPTRIEAPAQPALEANLKESEA